MAPAIVSAPIRRQGSARQSAPPYAGLDCVRHYDLGVGYAVAVATASLINPWLQKHEIPDNSVVGGTGDEIIAPNVECCGRRRTHEPSFSHRRLRGLCRCGTFSPARRWSDMQGRGPGQYGVSDRVLAHLIAKRVVRLQNLTARFNRAKQSIRDSTARNRRREITNHLVPDG